LATRPTDLFARPACSESGRLGYQNRLLALLLRIADEVDSSVDSPNHGDRDRHQWFLHAAESLNRADDVECHAGKVRKCAEDRYRHVLHTMEHMMFAVRNYASDIRQAVDNKRSEV